MTATSLGLLTQSRLGAQRACQRLHHYKYELGYSALVELGGRRFGTLMHKGLESWWKHFGNPDALEIALTTIRVEESDAFTIAQAEAIMIAYHHRWKDEPYEVISVEVQFQTQLRNPESGAASRTWMLAGKIDVILRDLRDGQLRIMEHKTSSEDISSGSIYWRRLRMDTQNSVYFAGARSLGYDVIECIYDVLGKPGMRPLKATPIEARKYTKPTKTEPSRLYKDQRETDETPEEYRARIVEALASEPDRYLQRGVVVRLQSEMEDALVDIWQLGQQMREAELAHRAPRNPSACMQYGHTCDFFDVCTGAAALDDTQLFERNENVHPELTLETKDAQ